MEIALSLHERYTKKNIYSKVEYKCDINSAPPTYLFRRYILIY